MKKVIKNESKDNKHILTLVGTVGGDKFFDEEFISAKDVRDSLKDVNKDIVVKLNSPGGDVFAGVEIYNYLASLKNHVTIEVVGVAASAASLIAMAGDKVIMRTGATMMIHEASTFAYGTKSDIQKTLNALDAIDNSIVNIYAERTGINVDDIKSMLVEETWLTADEAVKQGFADDKSSVKANKGDKKKVKNLIKFVAQAEDEDDEKKEVTNDEIIQRIEVLEQKVEELEEQNKETESQDEGEADDEESFENNSNWLFF